MVNSVLWSLGGGLLLSLLDPKSSSSSSSFRYIACYKPPLMLCSLKPDAERSARKGREERATLADLNVPDGLHIVGRLDRDSEGLLLLTDDGQFTNQVLSSESCHKRYLALVSNGDPSESAMREMRSGGLEIRGYKTRPPIKVSKMEVVPELPRAALGMDRPGTWISVVLNEGRHRQVRRTTAAVGHPTVRLVRVTIGAMTIDDDLLRPGEWRFIDRGDVLQDDTN